MIHFLFIFMSVHQFTTPHGIFRVLQSDCAFYECMSKGEAWDANLIRDICAYLPNRGTILDIGGHIGTHAIPYAKHCPRAKIYTFEPQSHIRSLLWENMQLNGITNLFILPHGAGHVERTVRMANDFTSDGYSPDLVVDYTSNRPANFGGLGITNDPRGEEIQLKTIDSMSFLDVTYMKIDIEGAETLAVYGARQTIERWRPILFIEQSDKNVTPLYVVDCPELATFSVTDYLYSLGYTQIDMGQSNYLYVLPHHRP